ncbi:tetratricopeptide repeat protein [Maribacter sp. LLG6340-A2]|uniref:tetratricopeptide repeat protein n=1 Tax=Maribacter sp. LLG6340-A2 TaxID=3160834 RepID=UPI00387054A8
MKLVRLLIITLLISSCGTKENTEGGVAQKKDYNQYLAVEEIKTTSKYFDLWNNKIRPDSMQLTSFGIVGGEYNRYFQQTGNIEFLKKAEQSLKRAVEIAAIGKAGYYRSLARNYISQHRFKEALRLTDSSMAINGSRLEGQRLYFDIHMELGNYQTAEKYLDSIRNMSDFGYLIRLAKWNDYKGDLDTTIKFMETASKKAESAKNTELMLWSYTNLADYYGHAGRIKDSYDHYLKALSIDKNNAYAKKGIAWILFSNDNNPKEALRILDSVTETYLAPDYFLLKAEIADYMGNDLIRTENLDTYFKLVEDSAYGDMYNAYNLGLYLEETEQLDKALELAKREVMNRPTPEAYSWLAFSHLRNGDKEKALEIMNDHVYGKTFEPALLYQAAEVYKANGIVENVKSIKKELIGALYELGPQMEKQIHDL